MGKIVFMGDSVTLGVGYGGVTTSNRFSTIIGLTAGYAAADIINAGIGGNNSAQMLARLSTDVIAITDVKVCAIMAGNNDCFGGGAMSQTVAQYKANITAIVQQLRAAGIKPVLFSMMFVSGTSSVAAQAHPYLKALEEVVGDLKVPYVDIYREYCYMIDRGEWATYQHVDNVHPPIAGQAFIAEYALRPKHSGFFVADPVVVPDPEPIPEPGDPSILLAAVADYVLATGHPDLTEVVAAARSSLGGSHG